MGEGISSNEQADDRAKEAVYRYVCRLMHKPSIATLAGIKQAYKLYTAPR